MNDIPALRGEKVETLGIKTESKDTNQYILEFKSSNEYSGLKDRENFLSN